MDSFDDRWERLVAAARNAGDPGAELHSQDIEEFVSRARCRSIAQPDPLPSAHARAERRSLVAIAALLAGVLLALLPCRAEVHALLDSASSDLAGLPSRVPRPPHPPSTAFVRSALPDLRSLLDLTPFATESQP